MFFLSYALASFQGWISFDLNLPGVAWPSVDQWWRVISMRDYNTRLVVFGVAVLGAGAGLVGSFTLLRKRALMGDALSHAQKAAALDPAERKAVADDVMKAMAGKPSAALEKSSERLMEHYKSYE